MSRVLLRELSLIQSSRNYQRKFPKIESGSQKSRVAIEQRNPELKSAEIMESKFVSAAIQIPESPDTEHDTNVFNVRKEVQVWKYKHKAREHKNTQKRNK